MKTYLLVTITSPDHPGIVERITEVIASHHGNWEESRMAHLGGDFAGIVSVSVAQSAAATLADALRALSDENLTVAVREANLAAGEAAKRPSKCKLCLSGADHEGIVHKVAAYLAEQGVNVETMDTGLAAAPMSATPLFSMDAEISLPGNLKPADLDRQLQQIADEVGVDISIEPATD